MKSAAKAVGIGGGTAQSASQNSNTQTQSDIDVSNEINVEGIDLLADAIAQGAAAEAQVKLKSLEVAERYRVALLILGAGGLAVWWSLGSSKRKRKKGKK